MRANSSGRRSRGRNNNNNNNNRRPSNNRSQVFDSNGPDVRIRGTAHQVNEKYLALAKDAASGGDLILAESYLQHAEHYQRIVNTWNEEDARLRGNRAASDESDANEAEEEELGEAELSLPASILTPAPRLDEMEEA
ncbi:MAG: DUF4167 domain-containing protein [Rhodospirillales bacterium]|nr:DUF4167 domain-containing protein [Rhodospirillales bacterium]MCB9965266.1 DUF4167 domain-containing protein [Rhodospirillales bacterium]MCB9972964.1 DUF4167 domain-containing protein [Rhodospirillales bacterium]MCB9980048.1 DUF4167 domain-containing protein [Rhodospirillales bacterium]